MLICQRVDGKLKLLSEPSTASVTKFIPFVTKTILAVFSAYELKEFSRSYVHSGIPLTLKSFYEKSDTKCYGTLYHYILLY